MQSFMAKIIDFLEDQYIHIKVKKIITIDVNKIELFLKTRLKNSIIDCFK